MNTRFVVNCALVLLGLLPVLYLLALFAWQMSGIFTAHKWVALPVTLIFTEHTFPFLPEFRWTAPAAVAAVLDRVHVGLVPAIAGLALAAFGALRALEQFAGMRAAKRQREDRLRRIQDYRRQPFGIAAPDGRREPYIGPA